MNRINIACFDQNKTPHVYGIWQWDYGQVLRIQGLTLPSAVEIDFSLQETSGESVTRIGVTKDGVTDVVIPDSMLEKDTTQTYYAYAFIYLTDDVSGQTEYKVIMHVTARPKPEGRTSDDTTTMAAILKAVNEIADRTGVSDEKISEAVNNYLKANPIEESDPTVPEWAKSPEKPSYTAEEVRALPDNTQIPSKTSDLQNDSGFLTEHQDLSNYATKEEIPKTASDIGADAAGTADNKVATHNTALDAHSDIRLLIEGLTSRLNTLADSDDTTLDQMSEIVAYIKSNKSLIDAITTSKVSVSDIIDNLTTNVSNKPLSAAQGVALKALIDEIVIPDKLPNPQKLTFTGGVTAEYDGSGAVTVTIPEGSGGSGGTVRIEKESTDTAVELEPNKLYIFPEMAELTITLAESSDTSIVSEYHFVFHSGTTATILSLPDTIKLPSGFTVDASKIYEISILEGCLCAQSWAVS